MSGRAVRIALALLPPLLAACSGGEGTSATLRGGGTGGDGGGGGAGGGLPFSQGTPPQKAPPKDPVGGFAIDLPAETLAAGEERSSCYIFPLEIQGPSRFVAGGSLEVGLGMHHGNITTRPKTGEGFRPCPPDDSPIANEALDIIKGGAVLFGSSTQITGIEWQSFPEGMAYRVKDGFEIVARMHYLNTSPDPRTIEPRYRWYTIAESAVAQEIGPFAWTYGDIEIPPLSEHTVKADCAFPAPMRLVNVLPHMHRFGVSFRAGFLGGQLDGQVFLDSPGYDPDKGVMTQYHPAIDLAQGDGASFSCTWQNTLDKALHWGLGDDEMCILFGYAYPPESAFSAYAGNGTCLYVAPPPPEP